MKKSRWFLAAMIGGWLALGSARAANLVTNGDFETGTNGFRSDYAYDNGPTGLYPEGNWSVVTLASDVHPDFVPAWDYTLGDGSGHYFVANGASDTSQAVWQSLQSIHIAQAGTAYRFEAYLMTCVPVEGGNGPILKFQVGNGTDWADLGETFTFADGAPVGAWNLTFADGVFSQVGSYSIRLLNSSSVLAGNDFGLDNVLFDLRENAPSYPSNPGRSQEELVVVNVTAVPEPPGLATLGMGAMLLLATVLRRKLA